MMKGLKSLESLAANTDVSPNLQGAMDEIKQYVEQAKAELKSLSNVEVKSLDTDAFNKISKKFENMNTKFTNMFNDLNRRITTIESGSFSSKIQEMNKEADVLSQYITKANKALNEFANTQKNIGQSNSSNAVNKQVNDIDRQIIQIIQREKELQKIRNTAADTQQKNLGSEYNYYKIYEQKIEQLQSLLYQLNQSQKKYTSVQQGSDHYKNTAKQIDDISYNIQKLLADIQAVQDAYDEFLYDQKITEQSFDLASPIPENAEKQISKFISEQKNIYKKYQQKYPELFQKYRNANLYQQNHSGDSELQTIVNASNPKGSILTEIKITTNATTLQKQVQRILDSVAEKIKPITIPIQFVSAYKSEIQKEIKDGESTLSNIQKQYSKALERDIKTIKNQLANVEIRPSVKLEPEELTKIQSQLDKIRFNLTADLNVEKVEIPKKIIGDSVSTIIKQVATGVNENQKTANKKNKTKSKNEQQKNVENQVENKTDQPKVDASKKQIETIATKIERVGTGLEKTAANINKSVNSNKETSDLSLSKNVNNAINEIQKADDYIEKEFTDTIYKIAESANKLNQVQNQLSNFDSIFKKQTVNQKPIYNPNLFAKNINTKTNNKQQNDTTDFDDIAKYIDVGYTEKDITKILETRRKAENLVMGSNERFMYLSKIQDLLNNSSSFTKYADRDSITTITNDIMKRIDTLREAAKSGIVSPDSEINLDLISKYKGEVLELTRILNNLFKVGSSDSKFLYLDIDNIDQAIKKFEYLAKQQQNLLSAKTKGNTWIGEAINANGDLIKITRTYDSIAKTIIEKQELIAKSNDKLFTDRTRDGVYRNLFDIAEYREKSLNKILSDKDLSIYTSSLNNVDEKFKSSNQFLSIQADLEQLKQYRNELSKLFTTQDIDAFFSKNISNINELQKRISKTIPTIGNKKIIATGITNIDDAVEKLKELAETQDNLSKQTLFGGKWIGEIRNANGEIITITRSYNALTNAIEETTKIVQKDTTKELQEKLRQSIVSDNKILNYESLLKGVEASPSLFNSATLASSVVNDITNKINRLKTLQQNAVLIDPSNTEELARLKNEASELTIILDNIFRKTSSKKFIVASDLKNIDEATAKFKELAATQNNLFSQEFKGNKWIGTIQALNGEVVTITRTFDELSGVITETTTKTTQQINKMQNFITSLGNKWREVARYMLSYGSLQEVFDIGRRGFDTIKSLDYAMTEVRKVSNETKETYESFQEQTAETAKAIASTNAELLNSSADWLRLGESIEDASELSKNAAIYVNVGDGIDIDTATKDMITSMKAFDIQAKDSMQVVDAFNEVGNNFSISSAGIGEVLERSASALAVANNSFAESIALATATNEQLQNTENAGSALKIFSLRLRGAKTEIEEMGESTDGMAESTSKMREQILALTNVTGRGGFDILTETGDFKSTAEIAKGLGQAFEVMNDIDRAALLELVAGKNRANAIASLLMNWETIDEVIKSVEESEGSALRENEAIVDSINGRIKILSATAEEFWQQSTSSDGIKLTITLLTELLELLTSITSQAGLLTTALSVGFGTRLAYKGMGIQDVGHTLKEMLTFKQVPVNDAMRQIVKEYNELIPSGTMSLDSFLEKHPDITKTQKQYLEGLKNGIADEKEFANATNSAAYSVKSFAKTLKTAAINIGAFMAISIALQFAFEKLSELNVTYKEQQTIVDELGTDLSKLKEEYDKLSSIDTSKLTEQEKERIGYLERIIALKEHELEIENKRLSDSYLFGEGDAFSSGMLGGGVDGEDGLTTMNYDIEKLVGKTEKSLDKLSQARKEYQEVLKNEEYQLVPNNKFVKQEELQMNQLSKYLDELTVYEAKYTEIIQTIREALDSGMYDNDPIKKDMLITNLDIAEQKLLRIQELIQSTSVNLGLTIDIPETRTVLKEQVQNDDGYYAGFIDTLSDEEVQILYNLENFGDLTFDDVFDMVTKMREEAKTPITFKTTISGFGDLENGFNKLSDIYNDIVDGKEFDYLSLIDEDFVNEFSVAGEEYNKFIEIISNSPTDINACKDAFNSLAEAYIYNSDALKNITPETYDLSVAYLKQLGVTNAQEVASYALAQSYAQAYLETANLTTITGEQINAFVEENEAIGVTKYMMYDLALTMIKVNETGLDFSQQITALNNLAVSAGIASASIASIGSMQTAARYYSYSGMSREEAEAAAMNDYVNSLSNKIKSQFNVSTPKPNISYTPKINKSNSGSKDKSDPYVVEIDKFKLLKQAIEDVEAEIQDLDDLYSHTEDIEEQILLKDKLIGLYDEERKKIKELDAARDKEIQNNVNKLKKTGFNVSYDPENDKLYIKNMDHINSLSQDVIKDYEELISKTEELNKENQDSKDTWEELTYKISKAQKEINDLKHSLYEEKISDSEHLIELIGDRKGLEQAEIMAIQQMMKDTLLEWKRLVDDGYEANKETIQDLEKAWMDYYDQRLEKEKELLELQLEDRDGVISAVTDLIDERIAALEAEKEELQKINEERNEALKLQQAQAALDKAKNQKTRKVLRKNEGYVYEADEDAIREAEENLSDIQYEMEVKRLDDQIDALNKYKDLWSQIPDEYEKYQNRLLAQEMLGADWEDKILQMRQDTYENFRDNYFDLEDQIAKKTTELNEHLGLEYNKMLQMFLQMSELMNQSTGTGKTWYVQKNGQAPPQAQIGDKIITAGGTYQIVAPNTPGAGYNKESGFWNIKVNDNKNNIPNGLWGTEVTNSLDYNTLSNQKIVDTANNQIDEIKKSILATGALSNITSENAKVTDEQVAAILENLDVLDGNSIEVNGNTFSIGANTYALSLLTDAINNFELNSGETGGYSSSYPIDGMMSAEDRAAIRAAQAAYNLAKQQGNQDAMDQAHQIAESIRDKYRTSGIEINGEDFINSNGIITSIDDAGVIIDDQIDMLVQSNEDLAASMLQVGDQYGKQFAGMYQDTTYSGRSSQDRINEYKWLLEKNKEFGGSQERNDLLESAIAREEAGSGHSDIKLNDKNGSIVVTVPNNPAEAGMSASEIRNQNKNNKVTNKNSDAINKSTSTIEDSSAYVGDTNDNVATSNENLVASNNSLANSMDKLGSSFNVSANSINGSTGGRGHLSPNSQLVLNSKYTTVVEKKAKGGLNLNENLYNIDEVGNELVVEPTQGRYVKLSAGSSVIPADITKRLWEFGQNPSNFLKDILNNTPQTAIPMNNVNHIVHNTYQIDSIQLPNVSDVQSFINEFKNLPNLAQQYTLRR